MSAIRRFLCRHGWHHERTTNGAQYQHILFTCVHCPHARTEATT